jgi:hypothetical protein
MAEDDRGDFRGLAGRPQHLSSTGRDSARQAGGGLPRNLSIKPWDDQPPPSAQNFFLQELDNMTLPAGAGATVQTSIAGGGAKQIPPNNVAVIGAVSWFASAPTTSTNILFTVRQNQSPILGLTNLKFPPQNAGFINFALAGTWDLAPGAFLDVLITNRNASGPWLVNFTITGWFVPAADVHAWTGQWPGQIG